MDDASGVFNAAFDSLSGDFDLLAMVGGWEGAFDLLIDAMNGQLFGLPLPLIGDALRDEAQFLQDIRSAVSDNLQDNASTGNNAFADVQQAIFDALGPSGINVLRDTNSPANDQIPDGQLTRDDVFSAPDPSGHGRYFQIAMGSDPISLDLPVDFDLGVPGLALDIDAPINVALGYNMVLGMGVNLTDGFYLDTSDPSEVEVFLDVTAPGLSAAGELGFLRVHADDRPTAQSADWCKWSVVISSPDHGPRSRPGTVGNDGVALRMTATCPPETSRSPTVQRARELVFTVKSGRTTAGQLVNVLNNDVMVSQLFSAALPLSGNGQGFVNDSQTVTTVADLPSRFQGRFAVDLVDPAGPAGD